MFNSTLVLGEVGKESKRDLEMEGGGERDRFRDGGRWRMRGRDEEMWYGGEIERGKGREEIWKRVE